MKKTLIFILLLISCLQNSFSTELESAIEAQYINDELIINVKIYNPTDESYIFALSDWDVKVNNGNYPSRTRGVSHSFSNEIYFIIENGSIYMPFLGVFEYKFDKIPHFVHLFDKDTLDLTIHIKQKELLEPFIKDTNYKVFFDMCYSEYGIFIRSLRNFNCKLDDLVSNENHYNFNLQKTKKRYFHVGVPHFKGCKWDKKYSEILDIGFVNWIGLVTQFYVPGDR